MQTQPDDDDPIVAEIRQFREEYLASFGYDMDLLIQDVKRNALKWPLTRVSYKKRPATASMSTQQHEKTK